MRQECVQLIQSLENIVWFTIVGNPVDPEIDVVQVDSWPAAYAKCQRYLYENGRGIAAMNALGFRIQREGFFRTRYRDWNRHIREIRAVVDPLVEKKAGPIREAYSFGPDFFGSIQYDIAGACMEYEYLDCVPTGHFVSIMPWYLQGHFPCGWEGHFPEGKLIIY